MSPSYSVSELETALAVRTALCVLFGVLFAVAVLINVLGQPFIDMLLLLWN